VGFKRRAATPVMLLLCAALAVSCTVSTEKGDASPVTPAATAPVVTPTIDAGTSTAPTAAPAAATAPPESAAPTTTGPPARGVTADTIKLGYAVADLAKVKDLFGVDVGNAPPEAMQALVDATNAAGGINGRQIELVKRQFLPVGEEEAEKACRELIEDEQVFAVLGSFIGDTALCVTETYSTPYFGNFGLSPQRQARSKAPFVVTGLDEARNLRDSVQLLLDNGLLAGKKVAVVSDQERDEGSVDELVVGALEAAGVDVVSQARLGPTSTDAVAGGAEIDRVLQRFEADGADVVVAATGVAVVVPAFSRTSYRPQLMVVANGQLASAEPLTKWGVTDPSSIAGAIGAVYNTTASELVVDPMVADCFATIAQYSDLDLVPDDVYSTAERPESKAMAFVTGMCELWPMVVQVLTAAGPSPTPASIVAGLDRVGPVQLLAGNTGSLSSTNWAATTGSRLWNYDESQIRFFPADENG
jgi:hypothetical protein